MWLLTMWWMGSLCSRETLCLILSFCTLTCQWQGGKQHTHFLCLCSSHGFSPCLDDDSFHVPWSWAVVQLSCEASKSAHKVETCCFEVFDNLQWGLCSTPGWAGEIWVNTPLVAFQGVWALRGELGFPLTNSMVSPCTYRNHSRA